jgi:hypothetical protein
MSAKQHLAVAAVLLGGLLLSACTSNGPGSGGAGGGGGTSGGGTSGGSITSGSSSGGPPNDGTGPTNITSGGSPVTGNFICTQSATAYGDVTTQVGANGLVGSSLSSLVNGLGGADATTLLNSVINPNNVIDGNLSTFATMSLAAGLLGSVIDSVDLSVVMPIGTTVPAGQFAVFGVSFPGGTADVSLINSLEVFTSLAGGTQESNTTNQSALSLLGVGVSSPSTLWFGLKTTKPYDTATISLTPAVLSADVGDDMQIYEFCPGGSLVTPSP